MVLVLALLTAGFSAAAAEPLQPYFLMDQDTFLSWFREFDEKADYNWNQWQFTVPVIDNVNLEGVFADSGIEGVVASHIDDDGAFGFCSWLRSGISRKFKIVVAPCYRNYAE